MNDIEKTTYLPSEMAEEIKALTGHIGITGTNLDEIAFGNMTQEELQQTLTNPGSTDPQHYEDIAEAINELREGIDFRDFDIFVEKVITENGEYIAFDDDAYGYSVVQVEVEGSGEASSRKPLIERTIQIAAASDIETVGPYAFYGCSMLSIASFPNCKTISFCAFQSCSNLLSISFPACTSVGAQAFLGCSSLTNASFPKCTLLEHGAFEYCQQLTNISFPACTTIGENAFYGCSMLSSADFPACTTIDGYAFEYCQQLTNISFPACTTISGYAFLGCSRLTTVNCPACTQISTGAFMGCTVLTSISFPACTSIGEAAFEKCYALRTASFPACTVISSFAFRSCSGLYSLYLMNSVVVNLVHSNAFANTPFDSRASVVGKFGSIYVPTSLYKQYISASNWRYYSFRFVAAGGESFNAYMSGTTLMLNGSSVSLSGSVLYISDPDVVLDKRDDTLWVSGIESLT